MGHDFKDLNNFGLSLIMWSRGATRAGGQMEPGFNEAKLDMAMASALMTLGDRRHEDGRRVREVVGTGSGDRRHECGPNGGGDRRQVHRHLLIMSMLSLYDVWTTN